MDCPMILAGLNEERVRKIGFYLRHDVSVATSFFRTLKICNALAEMLTVEMSSIIDDQEYWNRIGTSNPSEIFFFRLFTHGPVSFFRVLYNTIFRRSLENTGNEADEIEHHLSVLRAKMNDLSCLLASVSDSTGYLKRSYLVSNNRHFLYLICDTNTSLESSIDGISRDNSDKVLEPLRRMCLEDVNCCLDTLLTMLHRFQSSKFTPPNIPCVSPRITTGISLRKTSSYVSPTASSSANVGDDWLSSSPGLRSSMDSGPSNRTTPLVNPIPPSYAPGDSHTHAHTNTSIPFPPPLTTTFSSSSNAEHAFGDKINMKSVESNDGLEELNESTINDKLTTILHVLNEIAPHSKTTGYPLGLTDYRLRRPTEFNRYWIRNLFLTTLAGVGLFHVAQALQSGELQAFVQVCWRSLIIKFNEHLVEPLDKLAHELFDSKFKEGIVVTKEELQQSYIALSRMLDDYYANVVQKNEPDKSEQIKLVVEEARNSFLMKAQLAADQTATTATALAADTKENVAKFANFSDSKIVQTVERFSSYMSSLIKHDAAAGASNSTSSVSDTTATSTAASSNTTTAVTDSGSTAMTGVVSSSSSSGGSSTALQPFDLKEVGTTYLAPSPITTRSNTSNNSSNGAPVNGAATAAANGPECYMYKKLTALDIIEMQTKSSIVMEELMKDYERELKSPIKGMITGNLMRSMLIQLQKLKVHTEAAMLTMDQILASNELTIAATAALPAVMILGVCWNMLRRAFTSKPPKPGVQTLSVRLAMVKVERSLQNVFGTLENPHSLSGQRSVAYPGHYLPSSQPVLSRTGSSNGNMHDMELDGSLIYTNVGRWTSNRPAPVAVAATSATAVSQQGKPTLHRGYMSPGAPTIEEQHESQSHPLHPQQRGVHETPSGTVNTSVHNILDQSVHAFDSNSDDGAVDANKGPHTELIDTLTIDPSNLRARGMLVYRIIMLQKAMIKLFLVQRPIIEMVSIWWHYFIHSTRSLFTKRTNVSDISQLLSWLKEDVTVKNPSVLSYVSVGKQSKLLALSRSGSNNGDTEYRNLHRDLLELSAPFYEIGGSRKLATAARMRNSYQCLAPPSN